MGLFDITNPIITFFLGCIFTLLLKKRESKREIINRNINEICDCVNEWYNQIHTILVEMQFNDDPNLINKKIYGYNSNRLILPKLLRNLEILKKYGECVGLVKEVEEFLALVTHKPPQSNLLGAHIGENVDTHRCMQMEFPHDIVMKNFDAVHYNMGKVLQNFSKNDFLEYSIEENINVHQCSQNSFLHDIAMKDLENLLIQLDSNVQKIGKSASKLIR